jgi:hypothetical protein
MTPARQAGALAQRAEKLRPFRLKAAQHRAAGRTGTADAIAGQIARLEGAEPAMWLAFTVAQVGRYLEGVGR